MASRLTFGVELEFSFATIQPGTPDPQPHLPQPVFVLQGQFDNWFHRKHVVFDAIIAELVAAGLPARAIKEVDYQESRRYGTPVSSSSSGSSRYQDDGVGWIPSRKHRWSWEEHPWAAGSDTGDANDKLEQGEAKPDSGGNDEGKQEKEKEKAKESEVFNNSLIRYSRAVYGPEWRVTDDMTIEATRPRDYDWFSVEVQSPPYIFSDDALHAVKLACHTLTRHFRLETNASTGLHVHVGHGADGPPYATLRNLMAFLWTFEPQLDQLNPSRRPGLTTAAGGIDSGEPYSWYESLRRGSRLAGGEHDGSYRRPRSVLAGLYAIYAVRPDAVALYDMLRATAWKSAYHIGHVAYPAGGESIKRTVEFRQHAGTLDGERIVQWVRTVVGIVEFVDEVDGLMLLDFLVKAAGVEDAFVDDGGEERDWGGDGDAVGGGGGGKEEKKEKLLQYDIVQLLRDIGLESCADYWDKEIPAAKRIAPTPYHWSPRKLVRRPEQQVGLGGAST